MLEVVVLELLGKRRIEVAEFIEPDTLVAKHSSQNTDAFVFPDPLDLCMPIEHLFDQRRATAGHPHDEARAIDLPCTWRIAASLSRQK